MKMSQFVFEKSVTELMGRFTLLIYYLLEKPGSRLVSTSHKEKHETFFPDVIANFQNLTHFRPWSPFSPVLSGILQPLL